MLKPDLEGKVQSFFGVGTGEDIRKLESELMLSELLDFEHVVSSHSTASRTATPASGWLRAISPTSKCRSTKR